jgi:hypothetical protein
LPGYILSSIVFAAADAQPLSALMQPTPLLSLGFVLLLIGGGRLILIELHALYFADLC